VDLLIGLVVVAGGFAVLMAAFAALAARIRRRGIGGALMGPIDEIWRPAAHRFRFEIEAASQRALPVTSPGDPHRRRGRLGRG
jgi:hypothetical protein